MIVPIDALKPILKDLLTYGRVPRPARPWLGIYAAETEGRVVVVGLSPKGPAQQVEESHRTEQGSVKLRQLWATGQWEFPRLQKTQSGHWRYPRNPSRYKDG